MKLLAIAIAAALGAGQTFAQSNSTSAAIDTYIQPYLRSGNLMGVVRVEKSGKVVFEKAYGFADRELRVVMEEQRERVFEVDAGGIDAVALAIEFGRRRHPGNDPALRIDRFDL